MTTTESQIEQVVLPVKQLVPHPKNIRGQVADLGDLVASIKARGVLQPLVVVPNGKPDHFQILAGHRRHAAAKKAGVTEVPCVVRRDLTDEADQIAAMIVENTQREDLTAVEEARGVQELLDLGDNVKAVASRTGMSVTKVRQRVKVAKLPHPLQDKLTEHQLSLADAVFIADHAGHDGDMVILDRALGTPNWASAKERVRDLAERRAQLATLTKELADAGYRVVEDVPGERHEVADRLGVEVYHLVQHDYVWPLTRAGEKAVEAGAFAAVFAIVRRVWMQAGEFEDKPYIVTLQGPAEPAPRADEEPPAHADEAQNPDTGPETATSGDGASGGDEAEAEATGVDVFAEPADDQQERWEMLAAATRVRRDFIRAVIRDGDQAKALAAIRMATDFSELDLVYLGDFWAEAERYLGNDDAPIASGQGTPPADWIREQANPSSIVLAWAWSALDQADQVLRGAPYMASADAAIYDAELVGPYGRLLASWGYELSDVEQAVVDEAWELLDAKSIEGAGDE